MNSLFALNRQILDQAISLIDDKLGDHYSCPCHEVFSSTIGQHVRHCIEHYEEFFLALEEERTIDYENRPRQLLLEIDPSAASGRLKDIRGSFEDLPQDCRLVQVRDSGEESSFASSIRRELHFLASHTLHHLALIGTIAGLSGIAVPQNFGVAQSTLKLRENA